MFCVVTHTAEHAEESGDIKIEDLEEAMKKAILKVEEDWMRGIYLFFLFLCV